MEHTEVKGKWDKGSLSIEAAIVIPIFFLFVFFMISIIQYCALYFLTANACITCAEKFSSGVSVLYRSGLDSLDRKVRDEVTALLPDEGIGRDIATVIAGKAVDEIESVAVEGLMMAALENELQKEVQRSGLPFDAHVVNLSGSSFFKTGNEFKLCVRTKSDYLFPNFVTGRKGVAVDYTVRFDGWLYGGCPRYGIDDINVWELGNFERGRVLEEIYGANLPEKFPVIDIFDSKTGECIMLLSVDTTAPTYSTAERLKKHIAENVGKLRDFKGGEEEEVRITEKQIKSKTVILIIPDNEGLTRMKEICDSVMYGMMNSGVNIEVSIYQHSYVYEGSK